MGEEGSREKWMELSLKSRKQQAKLSAFYSDVFKSDSVRLGTDPCSLCYHDLSRFPLVYWALSEILFLMVVQTELHRSC